MLKIILLVALIRLLIVTDKPLLCSGIYTAAVVLLSLAFRGPSLVILIAAPLAFAFSTLYFWLLSKLDDSLWWWVVLVLGLVIGLV